MSNSTPTPTPENNLDRLKLAREEASVRYRQASMKLFFLVGLLLIVFATVMRVFMDKQEAFVELVGAGLFMLLLAWFQHRQSELKK